MTNNHSTLSKSEISLRFARSLSLWRSKNEEKKKLFREFAEFETHASYLTPFNMPIAIITWTTRCLSMPGIFINNLQLCITNIPTYTPCLSRINKLSVSISRTILNVQTSPSKVSRSIFDKFLFAEFSFPNYEH